MSCLECMLWVYPSLHDGYIQITDIDNHDTDRISGLPA